MARKSLIARQAKRVAFVSKYAEKEKS